MKDSTGAVLGVYVGLVSTQYPNQSQVVRSIPGGAVSLFIGQDGLAHGSTCLLYQQGSCGGSPGIRNLEGPYGAVTVTEPASALIGSTLYYSTGSVYAGFAINSCDCGSGCLPALDGACHHLGGGSAVYNEVAQVSSVSIAIFTPPFHVELP